MKSIPNDSHDPESEPLFDVFRTSQLLARERELATQGECPSTRELRDLADGRITVAWRREALARHIVYCASCVDRNTAILLAHGDADEVADVTEPVATPIRRLRPMRIAHLVAAAALLLSTWVALQSPQVSARPHLAGFEVTGASGLVPRSAGLIEGVLRRANVRPAVDGHLLLARLNGTDVEWERVEGDAHSIMVRAGEEVMLPLDRALRVAEGEAWLIVHSLHAPGAADLETWLPRLLRGEPVAGVEATERVFPQSSSH